jgi:hypothetical protein
MLPADAVLAVAGGAWEGSLNRLDRPPAPVVVTLQIDELVFAIGEEDFAIRKYGLAEWFDPAREPEDRIEAATPEDAFALLELLRQDAFVWQCGTCDSWIFTSNRPRIGVLGCSTCRVGGVDFRHADRAVGIDATT